MSRTVQIVSCFEDRENRTSGRGEQVDSDLEWDNGVGENHRRHVRNKEVPPICTYTNGRASGCKEA